MSNIKLLNENSVEIAKLDGLLKGVCNFLDTVFERVETDDPQLKTDIMGKLEGLLTVMGYTIDLIKINNEEILRIEHAIDKSKN